MVDAANLLQRGVHELSINIEIFNQELARRLMRKKFDMGVESYLDFIESAASVLGRGRVRSMLLVGIEPLEDTLRGVPAIAERGGVPVLSPFRPDPSTPMRDHSPPSADDLRAAYRQSKSICDQLDVPLGPSCVPCSHNTLTYARPELGDAHVHYGDVNLI